MKKFLLHIVISFAFLLSAGFGYASEIAELNAIEKSGFYSVPGEFSKIDGKADPQRFASPEERRQYWQEKSENIPHKSFWTSKKDQFKEDVKAFGHQFLGTKGKRVFDYVIDVVFDVPLLIVLLVLIVAFLFNVFLVAFIVVISNLIKNARDKYFSGLKDRYEDVLTNFLFEEINDQEAVGKLERVKTSTGRKILIEILFNYLNNLSGEYNERILMLYLQLGLQYESIRKISSIFFHRRVQGIRELANMYPSGAKNIIVRYIRDKNDFVRNEAQIAYVYLDKEASFDFLDNLGRPFSQWVQLNSLNFVKLHEKEVPSFDQWVNSENNDIQDFSIRMISYYQQSENESAILSMLDHKNEKTRLYAIQAVKHMSLIGARDIVKMKYLNETRRNKLEIIKAFETIGDERDFEFLDQLLAGDDLELKLAACRALYRMGDVGRNHLDEIKINPELDLNRFIEHVKDPRN